jgi:hypothetical protein
MAKTNFLEGLKLALCERPTNVADGSVILIHFGPLGGCPVYPHKAAQERTFADLASVPVEGSCAIINPVPSTDARDFGVTIGTRVNEETAEE